MHKMGLWGLILSFGWLSCTKQGQISQVPATDNIDTVKMQSEYSGLFVSAPGENVSGKALILSQNGKYSVALENFDAANGPDLHLYLSKEIQPISFIDIGKLKSTKGNQVYPLSNPPDFKQYKYVLIFCQQYNVLFGSAALK